MDPNESAGVKRAAHWNSAPGEQKPRRAGVVERQRDRRIRELERA